MFSGVGVAPLKAGASLASDCQNHLRIRERSLFGKFSEGKTESMSILTVLVPATSVSCITAGQFTSAPR